MSLLIFSGLSLPRLAKGFTFQYVSINIHSLLVYFTAEVEFTFQYVSINMMYASPFFLRVPWFTFQYVSINITEQTNWWFQPSKFTFQYVSINIHACQDRYVLVLDLHSNMSLLIWFCYSRSFDGTEIYIPICLY